VLPLDPARLALVVAGLLLIPPGRPTAAQLALLITIAVLLTVSAIRNVRTATILVLLVGGIAIRLVIVEHEGSDVLDVTAAAIQRVLDGFSPYGSGYDQSRPPGAPFPYGPVALLWYMPLASAPDLIELAGSFAVAVVLALQGRLVGLAVYTTAPVLVATAVDGSNDTSLGLLLLAAFMATTRWPAVGAAVLAVAVGFKLSALAWLPGLIVLGGARVAAAFVAASLVVWSPVIAAWGVRAFIRSAQLANDAHQTTAWSLGSIIRDVTGVRVAELDQLSFVLGFLIESD
jgi:hypothetical protein